MRCFLLKCIAKKATVSYIQIDFFCRPPQRRQPVQMLDQHHLKQYQRVYAGTSTIPAVQRFHHFIQKIEIYCLVYFPQQTLLRN